MDDDAQQMEGLAASTYDFIHSSHTLKHMIDPREALKNWIRITKPGGFLIIIVPDEDLHD